MKKIFIFSLLIFAVITSGCATNSNNSANNSPSVIPTNIIAYEIGNIDIDIVQEAKFAHYINKESFLPILKKQLKSDLAQVGLLASKKTPSEQIAQLDVFVDYGRRFIGDLTPFPVNVVDKPNIYQTITIKKDNKVLFLQERPLRTVKGNTSWIRGLIIDPLSQKKIDPKQYRKDFSNLLALSRDIVLYLIDKTPSSKDEPVKKLNSSNYKVTLAILMKEYAEKRVKKEFTPLTTPSEITDDYLQRLANATSDDIKEVYVKIYKERLLEPKVYSWLIKNKLPSLYESTSDYDKSTQKWLMKALASSGDFKFKKIFEDLAKNARQEFVKNYAEDALAILYRREFESELVHSSKLFSDEMTWKENQYANMIRSNENDLQVEALKQIYRQKIYADPLLKVVANTLTKESVKNTLRTGQNVNAHAWMCRILGTSENKVYLPDLLKVSENATYEKVRDYAEEFYDELD